MTNYYKKRRGLYINNPKADQHLKSQTNQSQYVTQLILDDIEQKQIKITTKEDIIEIIIEFITNNSNIASLINPNLSQLVQNSQSLQLNQQDDLIPDVKNSINDVLQQLTERI